LVSRAVVLVACRVLMELVGDFALRGQLGPVACGQPLADVQQVLGPYE
jgi:hypothetical protein